MGAIPQTLQDIRHAFSGVFCQNSLIGIFSRTKEPGAHTGEYFGLCVGRTSPHHRHREETSSVFFLKSMPVGQRVLVKLQTLDLLRIKKGFQLYIDHIHIGHGFSLGERCGIVIHLAHDPAHILGGIILGSANAHIEPGIGKTIAKTIIFIGIGQVAEDGGKAAAFQPLLDGQAQSAACQHSGRHSHQQTAGKGVLALGSFQKE